jgi:quinol monooxygenase YgiN
MEFEKTKVDDFLELFGSNRSRIAAYEGCLGLELHSSVDNPTTFYTYSTWRSEQDLENYRTSKFFKEIWGGTKVLFSKKPEAWSLLKLESDVKI